MLHVQIHQLSFSPHTDAKGIMDLVKFLSPKHVILVHGEKPKMASLKGKIESELGIPCYDPVNNENVSVPSTHFVKACASDAFVRSSLSPNFKFSGRNREYECSHSGDTEAVPFLRVRDERVAGGIVVMEGNKEAKVIHQDELLHVLRTEKHEVKFAYCFPARLSKKNEESGNICTDSLRCPSRKCSLLQALLSELSKEFRQEEIQDFGEYIKVESLHVTVCLTEQCPYRVGGHPLNGCGSVFFCCRWLAGDERLAWKIISIIRTLDLSLPI